MIVRGAGQPGIAHTYLAEILAALGFTSYVTRDLKSLGDAGALGETTSVVLLTASKTGPATVGLFRGFIEGGGVLVAFEPDGALVPLLGLRRAEDASASTWIAVDSTSFAGTGITSRPLKLHASPRAYDVVDASVVAAFYADPKTPTRRPAVTVRPRGAGFGVAFAFDLATSIALTRQGNPAWTGIPDNDTRVYGWRPDQMFWKTASDGRLVQSWNGTGDGTDPNDLNDVPQADELMRLLGNVIARYVTRPPIPRVGTFPPGTSGVLVMTGDHHMELLSPVSKVMAAVNGAGGGYTAYLWHPFIVPEDLARRWHQAGNELAVHLDFNESGGPSWDRVSRTLERSLSSFRTAYPDLPLPRTVRTDNCIWLGRGADGEPDPLAQARLFRKFGVEMDLSFVSMPRTWGYMTGSGLPMRFVDLRSGELIDVYEQATQYQDNSQMSRVAYSMQWSGPTMKSRILRSLEDSLLAFDTALASNLHPNMFDTSNPDYTYAEWRPETLGQILSCARDSGIMVSTAVAWLDFVKARRRAAFTDLRFEGGSLRFKVRHDATGPLPIDVPLVGRFPAAAEVDGVPVPIAVKTVKGTSYLRLDLPPGQHAVSVGLRSRPTGVWLPQVRAACDVGETDAGTGDFDGSGTLDLYCRNPRSGSVRVQLSDRRGGFAAAVTWLEGWCKGSAASLLAGDFNGDGRTDLACRTAEGIRVARSEPSGTPRFDPAGPQLPGWCSGDAAVLGTGDFDGDGRADLYCAMNGTVWVALSDKSGHFSQGGRGQAPWLRDWCGTTGSRQGTGDFNGDGRSDLYCHTANGTVSVALSDGAGAFVTKPSGATPWLASWCAGQKRQVVATRGDADLYCLQGASVFHAKDLGARFANDPVPAVVDWCQEPGARLGEADLDGDGRSDLTCIWGSATTGRTFLATAHRPHF